MTTTATTTSWLTAISSTISRISTNRDTVVYIHTNSTVDKTDEAWHVYPISTTTGTVKDYSKTRGTITMADDTVLELSVFADSSIWNVVKRNAVVALRLDTHGHVIDANAKAVRRHRLLHRHQAA